MSDLRYGFANNPKIGERVRQKFEALKNDRAKSRGQQAGFRDRVAQAILDAEYGAGAVNPALCRAAADVAIAAVVKEIRTIAQRERDAWEAGTYEAGLDTSRTLFNLADKLEAEISR